MLSLEKIVLYVHITSFYLHVISHCIYWDTPNMSFIHLYILSSMCCALLIWSDNCNFLVLGGQSVSVHWAGVSTQQADPNTQATDPGQQPQRIDGQASPAWAGGHHITGSGLWGQAWGEMSLSSSFLKMYLYPEILYLRLNKRFESLYWKEKFSFLTSFVISNKYC